MNESNYDQKYQLTNDFNFKFPTEIEYGIGKSDILRRKLNEYNIKKPLIVTDEGIIDAGLLNELDLSTINYKVFDKVEPNPKDYNIENGAEFAENFDPDGIIVVGGGSSIDAGKGINVLLNESGSEIRKYFGKNTVKEDLLPMIVLPTTAGTGSEVTFSAVISDSKNKRKMSIRSEKIAPDVAILDPKLTISLPKKITAYSGMDAFTHAIEAYTAKTATVITDSLALYSMEIILNNLVNAYNDLKDIEARSAMLLGSTLAGMSFNHSDVASVHCMAETLGGSYDAPHGLCNSVILPFVMEYSKDHCREKYARVAEMMGYEFEDANEGADKAVDGIREMNEKLDISRKLDLDIDENDIENLAQISAENLSNESNPRPMYKEDYIHLFRRLIE
ncbi:MAG: iron-containing alcohol dehydrogenase [Thermoplasmatota archaeon]